MSGGLRKTAFAMQRVGIEKILVAVGHVVFGPYLEGWKRKAAFDVFDDQHGELESILGAEVDNSPIEDIPHRVFEVLRLEQRDEVGDLIEPVGCV